MSVKGTTASSSLRNGLPEGSTYRYGGTKRDGAALTRNQVQMLALLNLAACSEDVLARRWPARSREGLRRTAGSLVALRLAMVTGGVWDITDAGRQTLEAQL